MTIKEFVDKRNEVEFKISKLIEDFEKETKATVNDLDFEKVDVMKSNTIVEETRVFLKIDRI